MFIPTSAIPPRCIPFHFPCFRNFFCAPLTLFISLSRGYRIMGTSHPRRSSLARLCWKTSKFSPLNSNPLNLSRTGIPNVRLCRHTRLLLLSDPRSQGIFGGSRAPLLGTVSITFSRQLIFDTPRVAQFMKRTIKFNVLNKARVLQQGQQRSGRFPTDTDL